MTTEQVTVTLDEQTIKALQILADKTFEGNRSMALRAHLRHSHLIDIIKHVEDGHDGEKRELGCYFCNIGN